MRSFMRAARLGLLLSVAIATTAACGNVENVLPDGPTNRIDGAGVTIDAMPGGPDGAVDAMPAPDAAPGMLSIDRTDVSAGSILVGQSSAPVTFVITNGGGTTTSPITTTVSGAGFTTSTNTCINATLSPTSTCQVALVFTPGAPGPASGSIVVSAPGSGAVMAAVSGTGIAPGALAFEPTSHNYNVVVEGQLATQLFTLRNTGGAPTSAVSVSVGGADAGLFSLVNDLCSGTAINAAGSCTVSVRITAGVGSAGARSGQVLASATTGGSTSASLSAQVVTPAVLSVSGSGAWGNVPLGMPTTRTFVVSNTGGQASGNLAVAITGANAGEFVRQTGVAGDCVPGTPLAAGMSCNVRVQFVASVRGSRTASLGVSATPGGVQTVALSATAQQAATLTSTPNPLAFGGVEVNSLSAMLPWTITNTGDVASSTPVLSVGSAGVIAGTGTCTGPIGPGLSCVAQVQIRPAMPGPFNSSVTATITGGSTTASITGTGLVRLDVVRNGTSGTITGPGINCPGDCTELVAPGTALTLTATTTNGSGVFFTSWAGTGSACDGTPRRSCAVTINAAMTATGEFKPINNNLVFISSTLHALNLGGVGPYDAACNNTATAAGINNTSNNAFIAWISSSASSAGGRMSPGSGWVRMDGRVFASSYTSLTGTNAVLNPIRFNELGLDVPDANTYLPTATSANGSALTFPGGSCQDWTVNTGDGFLAGNPMGGPELWTRDSGLGGCTGTYRLICMQNTFTAGAAAPSFAGKRVWLTNAPHAVSSSLPPDTACFNSRPSGVTSGRALISTTTISAASLLVAAQMYIRSDGQEVGTGTEIGAGINRAGIWQAGDGSYPLVNSFAWTGSATIGATGSVGNTCNNWTDPAQTIGQYGFTGRSRHLFWAIGQLACNTPTTNFNAPRLYCYEP